MYIISADCEDLATNAAPSSSIQPSSAAIHTTCLVTLSSLCLTVATTVPCAFFNGPSISSRGYGASVEPAPLCFIDCVDTPGSFGTGFLFVGASGSSWCRLLMYATVWPCSSCGLLECRSAYVEFAHGMSRGKG